MVAYIFKSAACLALLLLFYKVFLEKESMHIFKRFYLVGSLILSLTIPLLVFVEHVTVPSQPEVNILSTYGTGEVMQSQVADASPLDLNSIIWSIYCIGVVFFGFKFSKNLALITKRIRTNPKERFKRYTRVLLQENMPPHTFFKFIFLNKHKFESNEIPFEVLVHEKAHVTQKHSLDVIFIELLQVVLWFNPIVHLFKKAIKLNHEFLADQEVLNNNFDAIAYQNTLLSFSSIDKQLQPVLPNAINYSSIKKRLTIMKTKTSKKSVLIRSLLLLPLFSLLLYGFSDKKTITRVSNPITVVSKDHLIIIKINAEQEIFIDGKITKLKNISTELNSIIESNGFNNSMKSEVHLEAEGHLNIKLLTSIKKQLLKTKVALTMITADSIIINEKDLDATFKGTQFIAKDTLHIKSNDGNDVIGTSTPKLQTSATRKQMAEYNKLAKHYNNMPKNNMRIKSRDVERLTYIYNIMSEKQRKDAEPFPNFPEPPSPPKASSSKEVIEVVHPKPPKPVKDEIKEVSPQSGTTVLKEISTPTTISHIVEVSQSVEWARVPNIAMVMNQNPVSPELRSFFKSYKEKVKTYYDGVAWYYENNSGNKKELMRKYEEIIAMHENYKKLAKAEGVYAIPHPKMALMPEDPLPPHSQYLIDHVVRLSKKNETIFFYDDKKITNEKAIEILNSNKEVRVKSIFEKKGKTEVRMSSSN